MYVSYQIALDLGQFLILSAPNLVNLLASGVKQFQIIQPAVIN